MRRSRSQEWHWKTAPGRLGRLAIVQALSLAVLGAVAIAIIYALTQQVGEAQRVRQDAEEVRSALIDLRDDLRIQHVEYWKRREAGEIGVPDDVQRRVVGARFYVEELLDKSAAGGSPEALAAALETRRRLAAVQRGIQEIEEAPSDAAGKKASARNERVIVELGAAADRWVDAETLRASAAADRQDELANHLTRAVTGVVAALIAAALLTWLLLERTRRHVVEDLKEAADHLEDLAITDALTGLANRRGFDQALLVEVARARRTGRPMALVLFDIDHFKDVNDQLGHARGDVVLQEVARRLESVARGHELVARVGGEEFAWLLPDADAETALVAAERARGAVADGPVEGVPITVSAGVSDLASSGDQLVERADGALYAAKEAGRNRALSATS